MDNMNYKRTHMIANIIVLGNPEINEGTPTFIDK